MKFTLYDRKGETAMPDGPTVVSVGVFDGVHRGHRQLLAELTAEAASRGASPLALTLTAHPSFVLGRRGEEGWLDSPVEHRQLLFGTGVRYVAELAFTAEVASQSACEMFAMMQQQLNMVSLLLGYDSRFGSRQHDDFAQLPQLAERWGIGLRRAEPLVEGSAPVSSSRIRECLRRGQVDAASVLLGRTYEVDGLVVHGRGVGQSLGFPTANVDVHQCRKMMPAEGVYAVRVQVGEGGSPLRGIANLGSIPTFGLGGRTLEVHILDFDDNIYGQPVSVGFVRRLRETMRFASSEELCRQIEDDKQKAMLWL